MLVNILFHPLSVSKLPGHNTAPIEKARRFWPCNDVDSEISQVVHAEELMQPRRPIVKQQGSSTPIEARHPCPASLYQLYAPALYEYIRRHSPDLTDAEDILAEVFTGALRQDLTTLTPGEQRAWLWTVARNKVNDQYRQGQRRQQVSLESLGEIGEMLQDATTPEQLALRQEEAAYLRSYTNKLSAISPTCPTPRRINLPCVRSTHYSVSTR